MLNEIERIMQNFKECQTEERDKIREAIIGTEDYLEHKENFQYYEGGISALQEIKRYIEKQR